MYKFFRELQTIAKIGKDYKSVKELTVDLAHSGGYRREPVTLKNGKVVMRTKYGIVDNGKIIPTWDDILVAKWLVNYKDLFITKLGAHPELKDFFPEIIQRTFTITFNSLQVDKLKSDSNVNTIVYMCLANRIGEALIKKGSESRMESYMNSKSFYNKNSRERVNLKHAINHMALSLERLEEEGKGFNLIGKSDINDTVIAIKKELQGNDLGLRLLDSMVYSDTKVVTSVIDRFIKLNNIERTPSTLRKLKEAWNIIKSTLYSALVNSGYDVGVYDWEKDVKFKYSKSNAPTMC